jgi:hypothetical protein
MPPIARIIPEIMPLTSSTHVDLAVMSLKEATGTYMSPRSGTGIHSPNVPLRSLGLVTTMMGCC